MCLRVGTLVTVLVLCLVMAALAQPTTDKARQERAEWETALAQLKRDKPQEYDDTKRTATLGAQVLLGRLGYGLGPYTGVLDATTTAALRAYQQHRHLPVTGTDGKLMGIITDRDIRLNLPSRATSLSVWEINHLLSKLTVDEVMTLAVITVGPDRHAREAAQLMVDHKIGALPVEDSGRLIGIVTETDLLRAFIRMDARLRWG